MKSPLAIGRTIRNAKRTHDILAVFIRHGFRSVIEEVNLDGLIQRGKNLILRTDVDPHIHRLPQPVRLRRALEELGPTFVKMGQVLSLRPDLIPPEWADEFRKLHDTVQPVPYEKIDERLEAEFPGRVNELFRSIEREPLAAASVAQVHRAVLHDGREIVLKILRPGIEAILETDMDILRVLAEFAEEHFVDLGYSPTEVVEQFARELKREVDLVQEGRATDRFSRDFEDNPHIRFPTIYWEYTTEKILAMEEIRGTLLSRLQDGELSREVRHRIVANGTEAVFHQCLETGFFHADPHPGNIFVLPGGDVCFIDCGMTGHVDPATAGLLADLVQGVLASDLDRVIDVVLTLADADPAIADDRAFRADVWEYLSHFEDVKLEDLDIGALLREFFEKVRRNRLHCPSDIVFLIKAITTIESVGERLAPDFDLVAHAQPYVQRLVKRRYGFRAIRRRLQESFLGYANLLETLPGHVRSILFGLRRNRTTINLEHRGLDRLTDTIEHASGTIAHAVFIGSLIMGSSVLILADTVARPGERGVLSIIAGVTFVIAVVLAAGRAIMNKLKHHGRS